MKIKNSLVPMSFLERLVFRDFVLATLILITVQQASSSTTEQCAKAMKNNMEPVRNHFPHGGGFPCDLSKYAHSCCYATSKDKGVKHFKMHVYDCATEFSHLCHRKKYSPQNVLRYKDSTMAQEGRSFCIVGEHYRQSAYYHHSLAFQSLANRFFDIGNHIHPDDSTQMNTNQLFNIHLEFNRTRKKDGFSKVLTTTKLQNDFNQVYCGTRDRPQNLRWGKSYCDKARDYLTILEQDNSFKNRPAMHVSQMHKACANPYKVSATRILADGLQLQNYLHIKVYTDQYNTPGSKCPTGKMKFLMLEVRDHEGFPVGQFTDDLPCNETPCQDIGQLKCSALYGNKKHILPCMFTHHLSTTHPYIFMASANDTGVEYFTEVHITWRFAQSSTHFIKELHFATMIVEDDTPVRYYTSRQTDWEGVLSCGMRSGRGQACCASRHNSYHWGCPTWVCTQWYIGWIDGEYGWQDECMDNRCSCNGGPVHSETNKHYHCGLTQFCSLNYHASPTNNTDRPYGFSARYTAIAPKPGSIGGWDNVRTQYIRREDLDCHSGIPENDRNFELMIPASGAKYSKLVPRKNLFKDEIYRDVIDPKGQPGELKDYMTPGRNVRTNGPYKKNWGYVSEDVEKLMSRVLVDVMNDPIVVKTRYSDISPRSYLGTRFSKRSSPFQIDTEAVKDLKEGIIDMVNDHNARCPCPFVPTTPPPEIQTKGPIEKQARHLHAVNMFTAWIVMIPLGFFVARYYKETFSRVFFLQEFWWYTIHVLTLGTGLLFMCGSFYAMSLKRKGTNYERVDTDATTVHIYLGYGLFFVYIIHLMFGSFRAWNVESRIIQMALHWGVGWLQYAVAAVVILLAGAIPQGLLNCTAFYTYIGFFIVQICFYGFMEYRMRVVDMQLNLNPPRDYFPSPMMRLFHVDAPESKIRIVVLVLYFFVSLGFYTALHLLTDTTNSEASCFQQGLFNNPDDE